MFAAHPFFEAAKADGYEEGRLTFLSGDFFKDALPSADASILMEVILKWADAEAGQILSAVRASAEAHAKLLLIETEVSETHEPDWSKALDLVMMALFAARQRTVTEYRSLLQRSDFELCKAIDTQSGITIFEAS